MTYVWKITLFRWINILCKLCFNTITLSGGSKNKMLFMKNGQWLLYCVMLLCNTRYTIWLYIQESTFCNAVSIDGIYHLPLLALQLGDLPHFYVILLNFAECYAYFKHFLLTIKSNISTHLALIEFLLPTVVFSYSNLNLNIKISPNGLGVLNLLI